MRPAIIMFLYCLLSSSSVAAADEVVDNYLKEARKQLTVYSARAAKMTDTRCYQCGDCCKQMPCRHGKWDAAMRQCYYLEVDTVKPEYTTYKCAKYHEIVQQERGSPLAVFGGGCGNTLHNPARERIRRQVNRLG